MGRRVDIFDSEPLEEVIDEVLEPVTPTDVRRELALLVRAMGNVSVRLDFKDGVLTNAAYQPFWRRVVQRGQT